MTKCTKAILIFSFVVIFTETALARNLAGDFGIGLVYFMLGAFGSGSSRDKIPKRAWYWHKPGADTEQLQKDYAECRDIEIDEWTRGWTRECMIHKGYEWWPTGKGYWYKEDGTIEQLQYDYGQCKDRDTPCMEKKGYTWVRK